MKIKNQKIKGQEMKKEIHPEFVECKVTCACGNTFTTKSNKSEIRVDICSECHPFFTGSEKIVDSAGRVDKFKKKYNTRALTFSWLNPKKKYNLK